MINRRKFIGAFATVPVLLTAPSLALGPAKNSGEISALPLTPEILALEAQLRAYPNFDWGTHNELRHHYLPISERVSRMHADTILAHSIMDGYILNTLSDWHLTNEHGAPDYGTAAAVLLNNVERYGDFVHLSAACLIKAGDVLRQLSGSNAANMLYDRVLSIGQISLASVPTLNPYHFIAHTRLDM